MAFQLIIAGVLHSVAAVTSLSTASSFKSFPEPFGSGNDKMTDIRSPERIGLVIQCRARRRIDSSLPGLDLNHGE